MKKLLSLFAILVFLVSAGCKKGGDSGKEVSVAKKFAKYKVNVFKDKDLKDYGATLEKAEDVSLLDEEKYTGKDSKTIDISKVKLTDDSVRYIESKHLADSPIVFISDTKAFVRPTSGSSIYAVIPKGELGFIIAEKALWSQVYVGEIKGKFVVQHWVENGFTNDPKIVLEAKEYAAAAANLNDKDADKAAQAKAALETLSGGNSVIAELAKEKLGIKNEKEQSGEQPEGNSSN